MEQAMRAWPLSFLIALRIGRLIKLSNKIAGAATNADGKNRYRQGLCNATSATASVGQKACAAHMQQQSEKL